MPNLTVCHAQDIPRRISRGTALRWEPADGNRPMGTGRWEPADGNRPMGTGGAEASRPVSNDLVKTGAKELGTPVRRGRCGCTDETWG
jgi:hypothetical protein